MRTHESCHVIRESIWSKILVTPAVLSERAETTNTGGEAGNALPETGSRWHPSTRRVGPRERRQPLPTDGASQRREKARSILMSPSSLLAASCRHHLMETVRSASWEIPGARADLCDWKQRREKQRMDGRDWKQANDWHEGQPSVSEFNSYLSRTAVLWWNSIRPAQDRLQVTVIPLFAIY